MAPAVMKVSKKSSKQKENVNDLAARIKARALEANKKRLAEQNTEAEAEVEEEIVREGKVKASGDEKKDEDDEEEFSGPKITSFKQLDLVPELLESCEKMHYTTPTPIQAESIPVALEGRDIIGLAETGSGKTAAFAIPVLQKLWHEQSRFFALVLAPTRELAYQIRDTFDALGASMGVQCSVLVGGMDMMDQARDLHLKKPHIIVATPGRLLDHLENTKGFSLSKLKFLVMDEADRMLAEEFAQSLNKILKIIPSQRTTYLFSATMTDKVAELKRTSLTNPVKVAVSDKYTTVTTLIQRLIVVPDGYKNTYLAYLLDEFTGKMMIIFTRTCAHAQRTALLARILGFSAIPLHGQLSQAQRLGALAKFKSGQRNILVATDVAARGLDIPDVDIVINYDIPTDSKAYIHRVGRTARAGKAGKSISLVTQYDLEMILRIEKVINMKIPTEKPDRDIILALHNRVDKAFAEAIRQTKEFHENKKNHSGHKKRKNFAEDRG